MSMDPFLILQVIVWIIFINASKKEKYASGNMVLLLLGSWIVPIFFLGLLKAILVWILSIFVAVVINAILEKIGIISPEDSEKEHSTKTEKVSEKEYSTKTEKVSSTNSHKSGSSNNYESKIIRCPSCKKKIRVKLPLRGNKGKCVACSSSFSIVIDENGNLKANKEKTENRARGNHDSTPVSEHFKMLDIEPTATPEEVRAAYKKKIREYHPDRVAGLGDKLKKMANEESKAINIAYSALKSKGLST